MKIGTFTQSGDEYRGVIRTLSLTIEVVIRPMTKDAGALAPTHTVVVNQIEVGVAWPKLPTSRDVLKVMMDDPSFPVPLSGLLVREATGAFSLLWKRPKWRL